MKTHSNGDVLLVTGLRSLGAENALLLKESVNAVLTPAHRYVEVDLAQVEFVDSTGLGTLISFHKRLCPVQGAVRLVNPKPMVEQFFQLVKLDHLFEVVHREPHV